MEMCIRDSHSAIIDMGRGKITVYHETGEWSSEIVDRKSATHNRHSFTLICDDRTDYKHLLRNQPMLRIMNGRRIYKKFIHLKPPVQAK